MHRVPFSHKFKKFLEYYRWHLIFSVLVIVCLLFVYNGLTNKKTPDLRVSYCASYYMNAQSFNDFKYELELLIRDANGDKEKDAELNTAIASDEAETKKILEKLIREDETDIYISTKEGFESIGDKSVFQDAEIYYSSSDNDDIEYLKDGERIYAYSIADNTIAENFGITDSSKLYIAVASGDDTYRKNGRNIAGYILDNKYKYIY